MFVWNIDDVIEIVIIGSCIVCICIGLLRQAIKDFIEKKKRNKGENEEVTQCK